MDCATIRVDGFCEMPENVQLAIVALAQNFKGHSFYSHNVNTNTEVPACDNVG